MFDRSRETDAVAGNAYLIAVSEASILFVGQISLGCAVLVKKNPFYHHCWPIRFVVSIVTLLIACGIVSQAYQAIRKERDEKDTPCNDSRYDTTEVPGSFRPQLW